MHADLRQQVVNFMVNNAEDFAPFVEDDESFPTYISRMKKVRVTVVNCDYERHQLWIEIWKQRKVLLASTG